MAQLSEKNKKFSKVIKNNKKDKIVFDVEITNIEPINSEFSKAFIKIMYVDGNRNGSYFDKDMVINKMIPTLFNIPIVGNYIEFKDDFGSHDSKLEINSDGTINYVDLTVPYGVVNESAEISWELITEKDGTIHDYLCSSCILWTGRYPQVQRVIDKGNHQSMEVNCLAGYDDEEDGLFHVTDAEFSALTILGEDVEPCFESSSIEAYSLNKFKEEFSLMLKGIKNSLNTKSEDLVPSNFDLNNNLKNNKEENNNMKLSKKEIASKFELSYEQLEDELRRVLRTVTYLCEDDWWGNYECRKYYLEDYDADFVYAYNCEQDIYVKLPYSKQGDDVIIDFEKASRVRSQFVDWQGTIPEGEDPIEDDSIDAMGEMEMSLKETYKAKLDSKIEEAVKAKETEISELTSKYEQLQSDIEVLNKTISEKETELNKSASDRELEFKATIDEKDIVISEKETTIANLTEKFNKVSEDIKALETYKLKKETEAKEAKFAEYMDELTEEEMQPIREKINEYSLETIDDKLAITFAKKTHKINKNILPTHNTMDIETYGLKNNSDDNSNSNLNVWGRISENI